MSHPSQQNSSTHSLQEKQCVAQKLWSSWMVLLKDHQLFRMNSRCLSSFSRWAYFQWVLLSSNKEIQMPTKPKMHRPQENRYKEPLATGKALPGYCAVLLDTEDFLAKLCRCPAVRRAQTSRMRPENFYLPQISYVKMAEAKPSISAQTEHLKKPYPPESHYWGTIKLSVT